MAHADRRQAHLITTKNDHPQIAQITPIEPGQPRPAARPSRAGVRDERRQRERRDADSRLALPPLVSHTPSDRLAVGAGRRRSSGLHAESTGSRPDGPTRALLALVHSESDDPQTYKIIGVAMAVHRELGCGFLEAVSREAFAIELQERGIPFVREARLQVRYRNRILPVFYTVDFICYDEVLVELKALHVIGPLEIAQLINYLRIARRRRGLLLNFGATSLQHKRLVVDVRDASAEQSEVT